MHALFVPSRVPFICLPVVLVVEVQAPYMLFSKAVPVGMFGIARIPACFPSRQPFIAGFVFFCVHSFLDYGLVVLAAGGVFYSFDLLLWSFVSESIAVSRHVISVICIGL
ncbi:hypothetical protein N7G274_009247 [Stereocaulon virgatum]|uniref:Uncharacterized protein n=1 Tax=Stereocaulon virgatum TaxID=373712 RepID=A0ABR4A103_9LECA